MSEQIKIAELEGYLEKFLDHLVKIESFYNEFKIDSSALSKGRSYDLIILADIFTDFYTGVETCFVRISKFFENNLESGRWHSHLLEKMTIEIPGIRKKVIDDTTYSLLLEFMKFCHFRRYCYDFEYDRARMEYLEKKYIEVIPMIRSRISEYIEFLRDLRLKIGES